MESIWGPFGLWLRIYVGLISLWGTRQCWSLNDEGLTLLEFRGRITSDPFAALANWNPNDCNPCKWLGVRCVDSQVQTLVLPDLSLEGTLAPELGKLRHLKSLVLYKNSFSGTIPKELGGLDKLELLDLRGNDLTGCIPAEIVRVLLSKHLLVCDNKFEGSDSQELRLPSHNNHLTPLATLSHGKNRKFAHRIQQQEQHGEKSMCHKNFKQWNMEDSFVIPLKGALKNYLKAVIAVALPLFKLGKATPHAYEEKYCKNLTSSDESDFGHDESEFGQNVPNIINSVRRKLFDQSSNLAAAPFSGGPTIEISSVPITQSSGAFPAVPDTNKKQNQSPAPLPSSSNSPPVNQASQQNSPNGASGKLWKYIIIIAGVAVLVIVFVIMLCIWRKRAAKVIKPWKTGISGQLQKAFITGVPKLNQGELETACEDFSNIINSFDECTIYKGTLSSGVEIAVDSTIVTSAHDWSKNMETAYRKKIAALSRVNHKNFTNLIGYCDEEEPFTRMMVFEYAPNGNLFEHLHVEEVEPLDWSARMRVIMGTAYCLQYMHHDLNPPVAHSNLNSIAILLTDDFAAKISEISFGKHAKTNTTGDESQKSSELPPQADPETDVYNFGVLLLEIISGKLPYSEEQGHLANWAAEHLNDKRSIGYLIDPTLQSFKEEELEVICEVIKDCLQSDPRLRPTMKDITPRLREVLHISPEQAVPRLSPLWWAELEILSMEAT
ncbi:protein MALE DISCOVERER 2-like [Glycine soja]|uniref:Protein MALE DISCOVERER 2 isoform A n=1 Tax=Glycine soja TaxID=3848 RepID=A0A445KP34_GLYSO|nr:protein MALE DISCOVERER 2-like [Glycine soja]RZC12682.1 Protein MALE DISCOVERER 2 isoform A [Glycine soja]RZC12683.1 Protein MALE DISCOVERER 2 isoform B [Glycine soja]